MSDLGPVQLEHASESVFLGRDYNNKSQNFSEAVALEIDKEVRKIVDECYENATKILKDNKDLVMLLADTLMEKETITKEEIDELVANGKLSTIEEYAITDEESVQKKPRKKKNKENSTEE